MRIASTKDDISSIFTPGMLACAFAYAALKLVGSMTNGYLYPLVATTDGWIREISTLVIAATFLATTAVAYRKPQIVRAPALVALACVFTLAAIAFVGAGLSAHNVALLSLGIFCRSIGRALTLCLFALCLVQLESGKQVSFAIALGLFIFSVLDLFRGVIGTPLNAILLLGAVQIIVAVWATKPASRVLDITSAGDSVDDLKLADPTAFLPVFHGVFVCILLFSAASGFALTFNEVASAPPTLLANTPLLTLLLLFLLLNWENKREDMLFTLSVLIVMAGFLTTPLSFNETFANTSSTLLRFGEQCFDVLAWTVVAAIGRRNVYGCLVSAGVMQVMSSIGTLIGAMSGHITNDFVHTDFFMATGFALTMVFAFFAFLWCGFRSFSFTDAIKSVTAVSHPSSGEQGEPAADAGKTAEAMTNASGEKPAARRRDASPALSADDIATADNAFAANAAAAGSAPASDGASVMDAVRAAGTAPFENGPVPEAGAAAPAPDQLDENCAHLSDEFGLTAREREVFVLLAHGRNGRYIMDHLVIGRNTAKSHIKHIYSKLGVHSHQELINLATSGENR
ncbi:helix-turn-helix transcriptional regulator [Senegalimassilia anaerobia]|uniref:helix-turn-helix transcriptional regulator n=1 Tax=Senegalimassilia anaerobia TaxID=1473216 RepID=UPI00248EF33B|nr:helix-turn-helix transcriptional regulator [Senegalimassilia anaerobia]